MKWLSPVRNRGKKKTAMLDREREGGPSIENRLPRKFISPMRERERELTDV